MKAIIDRFEDDFAILELESGKTIPVSKEIIPTNAEEGSVLTISCDENKTAERRRELKKKMNSVFKK